MKKRTLAATFAGLVFLACNNDTATPVNPDPRPALAGQWSATFGPTSLTLTQPDTTLVLSTDSTRLIITLSGTDSTFHYQSQSRQSGAFSDVFTIEGTWSIGVGDSILSLHILAAASPLGPIPSSNFDACGDTVNFRILSDTRITTSLKMSKSYYCIIGQNGLIGLIENDPVAGPIIMAFEQTLTKSM